MCYNKFDMYLRDTKKYKERCGQIKSTKRKRGMKKRKRIAQMILAIFIVVTLSECGIQEASDASVNVRCDNQTVYLYANENCCVEIEVNIKNQEEMFSIAETVRVVANSTKTLMIEDIGKNFSSTESEILDVEVVDITKTVYNGESEIFMMLCVVLFIGIFFM